MHSPFLNNTAPKQNKPIQNNKTLMVQGCTSDAGKSVLVAGLCRVLARKDIKVVPFKPQNMALNSAVTEDGGEIGRAQAVQAQACHLAPHTDMNPVLLKPSSDTGAQVIIHGKAISDMQAQAFHDYKATAMQAVLESHHRLSAQYEAIIVEGAGSPAEINLRDNDIANMGFAEAIDCPVILIADIDRGGVFAHLHGTLDLLSESEQRRVAGFVINRFRGDIKLLESGLEWLEQKTGKPVFGVLPYLHDFYLDAEDAINTQQILKPDNPRNRLKVVIPVFPRISNHTDFDALRMHPEVELMFVAANQTLPTADLIILPGSKNVRADLAKLREYGWDKNIQEHLRYGGKLLGICGGYQMLGENIDDPNGIEDKVGSSKGLAWLDFNTLLTTQKKLKQVNGTINFPNGKPANFSGYEIHCGVIESGVMENRLTKEITKQKAFIQLADGNSDGSISDNGQIAGTYIHGLFDHPDASNAILQWAGLQSDKAVDLSQLREQQLNRLADCLEQHLSKGFFNFLKSNINNKIAHV